MLSRENCRSFGSLVCETIGFFLLESVTKLERLRTDPGSCLVSLFLHSLGFLLPL